MTWMRWVEDTSLGGSENDNILTVCILSLSHAVFGLDTHGLFPPHGMDPSKLYSPLMEMSDPRGMHPEQQPYLKKKGKFRK